MNHKIIFNLNLLELAFEKAIENLQNESNLLMQSNTKAAELDRIVSEKEDIMNFIEWHIPIIIRYIKMHKGDLDDINDISQLAIRSQAINKAAQDGMPPKVNSKLQVVTPRVSTITLLNDEDIQQPMLDVIFINDSVEMPKKLTVLLKELFSELERNFHKLLARKQLNDQIFNIFSKTIREKQKIYYHPKRVKENIQGNLIHNEDC